MMQYEKTKVQTLGTRMLIISICAGADISQIMNPFTSSNTHPQLANIYCQHENFKKHLYEQRVGDITTLSIHTTDILPNQWTQTIGNHILLASGLSPLHEMGSTLFHQYGLAPLPALLLVTKIFNHVHVYIYMYIRGAHSAKHHIGRQPTIPINFIIQETKLHP